jgi:multicomponent Na+:H+ antiporter subunit C
MTAAIIVGLLAAGGTYLILQRGHRADRPRLRPARPRRDDAAGRLGRASPGGRALHRRRGTDAHGRPLPQAFALTAIVISFGITAFLLTLAFRGRDVLGHDDVEASLDDRTGRPP